MKTILPYIVIIVLLFILFFKRGNSEAEINLPIVVHDTIENVKFDTVFSEKPNFIKEVELQPIYVEKVDKTPITKKITQKEYKDDNYHAWVSGVMPSLDSIRIFNKTIVRNITNEKNSVIYKNTTDVFLDLEFMKIKGLPAVGLGSSIKFKKGFMIGGNLGIYDNSLYYGLRTSIKINKR